MGVTPASLRTSLTFDDLSARLDSTKLGTASSFNNLDEAAAAVGSVLQRHQQEIVEWLSSGADLYLRLGAPFIRRRCRAPELGWCSKATEMAGGTCLQGSPHHERWLDIQGP
ncbi:RNase A-like domain-containing protein [Mycobacterium sp. ACS4331]|uniref:RNase A-like domain-containing protein n=1 Tax=Mycobacterium sp. ACS4331 TaxID=1834121 RepID=UPI00336AC69A